MKCGTSFFNRTLFRHNVKQLWPVWGLYTLIAALIVISGIGERWYYDLATEPYAMAYRIFELIAAFTIVAMGYGLILAWTLYGHLFSLKSTIYFGSLPCKKECTFATQFISGLSFIAVPNLFIFLILLADTASGTGCGKMALLWLGAVCAMELFFFGFATFVAMFTGRSAALPIFYLILLFLCYVLAYAVYYYVEPCLYGIGGADLSENAVLEWLTPVVCLMDKPLIESLYHAYDYMSAPCPTGLYVYPVYAIAGIAFAALGLLAYRKRKAESTGDLVTFRWASWVFLVGVGLTAALACSELLLSVWSSLSGSMAATFLTALLFGLIGCVAAVMIRDKSTKSWKKGFVPFGIVAGILILIMAGAKLDITGAVGRIPEAADVQSVQISVSDWDYADATLTSPEGIENVQELHSYALKHRQDPAQGLDCNWVYIDYTLKNGSHLERYYNVAAGEGAPEGGAYELIRQLTGSDEFRISDFLDGSAVTGELGSIWLSYYVPDPEGGSLEAGVYVPSDSMGDVYDAILQDALEAPAYAITSEEEQIKTSVTDGYTWYMNRLTIADDSGTVSLELCMETCQHTIMALIDAGVLQGDVALITTDIYA